MATEAYVDAARAVSVAAMGASTAVGRNAWATAAAVRAGISGFANHPYMLDTRGEPMRVAMAPWLEPDCQGVDRFAALLLPALAQALEPLDEYGRPGIRVGLALGLPIPRPGVADRLDRQLRERIEQAFPGRFAASGSFATGHAAGFVAMRAACDKIASGEFDACVLAGVDSYLSEETLAWLEAQNQLHGAGALNNAWGFIPGEAAGALLLVGRSMERLGPAPLANVLSIGIGFEQNRIKTQTVCVGEGLAAAFREALAALPPDAHVSDVFCDMNGEPYRADEFGFASLRTRAALADAPDFTAAADCWGDVAAASAPLQALLAAIAGRKRYANGPYAFLWASSESGERGACVLRLPTPSGA
jgi:3-oxoacyl-[acyl-carrier-protein] synthase-1